MKIVFLFLLCINMLFATQTQEETNTVKTSELELFLFKIGFQSLLKDVDLTKNKSSLNEEELKKLNSKIEIIMDELYKNKRVLKTDSSSVVINNTGSKKEIDELKVEVALLKKQMLNLQMKSIKKPFVKKDVNVISSKRARVRVESINVRSSASNNASVVEVLNQGQEVKIEKCNRFGWCKLEGEKKYIAKFLLNF